MEVGVRHVVSDKLAAIITTGDIPRIVELVAICREAATKGTAVRLFFRDESIPLISRTEVRHRITPALPAQLHEAHEGRARELEVALANLATLRDVELSACSSSLYLWGLTAGDLIPAISGARGLIAFLADDLDGAQEVVSC
jgi:peroxiredoxin family protein